MPISYNKLWKLLIDKGMKKPICGLQPKSVLVHWLNMEKTKALPRMY